MAKNDLNSPATVVLRWLAVALMLGLASCAKNAESDAPASNTTEPAAAGAGEEAAETAEQPVARINLSIDAPSADAPPSTTTDDADQASGVVIRGVVKFDGQPPERLEIDMTRVPECVESHGKDKILNEDAIVGAGGEVKNAFVYIKRAPKHSDDGPPREPAVLDQAKCMYRPRVQGIRVGQTLQIVNSDEFAHNVRGYPLLNPIFNIGQLGKNVREKVFDLAENPPIKVKCDIHHWMTAYVFVMDHPYFAVTDDDGTFEIAGLPPGDYTLALWHETFGKDQQEVAVGEKDVSGADFTLRASQ